MLLKETARRSIAYLLCGLLAWTSVVPAQAAGEMNIAGVTEAELRARYPDAQIIHTDAAHYPQLAQALRNQGYAMSAELPASHVLAANSAQIPEQQTAPYPSRKDDCDNRQGPTAGEESMRVMVDFSSDMMQSGGGNRDSAAVVFVIIGTVLIVVWALYVFKYLYDVAAGFTPCGKWSDLVLARSAIASDTQQHAKFVGLRYMTGYRDGATEFGISLEAGQADILLSDLGAPALEGVYWFIGPVLRWRLSADRNPHYFLMNFVAGSTEHDEMGVIAQANLGLQFGFENGLRLGVSWGAMNIDLKNTEGIITNRDEYYYLYGVNFGYQF